jgi:hypothetical protein
MFAAHRGITRKVIGSQTGTFSHFSTFLAPCNGHGAAGITAMLAAPGRNSFNSAELDARIVISPAPASSVL